MKRILIILLISSACTQQAKKIDIQGHRGARGLMPENTIPGFIKAVDLGVTTLELDLGVTGDGQILVSHEPWLSHEICLDTTGQRVVSDTVYNTYLMPYDQIKKYDCGSVPHPRFEDQQKMAVSKPLLNDVLQTIEEYLKENNLTKVNYNIELKTSLKTDDIYHPAPAVFSRMVYDLLDQYNMWDRITIQSFDFRTIKYFHETYPDVKLALLIENDLPWKQNIDSLGFTPNIYSCYYRLLSREIIGEMSRTGMEVIPWTINEVSDMQNLIEWGVDGIITDYPDRAIALINKNQ